MPGLNFIITGGEGAKAIIAALDKIKVKALSTEATLQGIGKTKVAPVGLSRLETELAKANAEVKRLGAAMNTAAASTNRMETEVAQLQAQVTKLTAATSRQTTASRKQIATNSALRDSTRGVAGALGGLWFAYGQLLPLMAAFATAASLRKGIVEGAEFAQQMQFVKGVTQATTGEINKASEAVLRLGEGNLRGPIELAQGMRVLTKAGLDLREALVALAPVTRLSVVGELEMAKATRIAAAAMNTFGKTAAQMGEVVNIIGKASIISATEVGELGNALSFMTGVAGLLNAELPEMAAQLAIAAQRGVTGSKAGTALNRAWLNLAAQTPKTKQALHELGVKVFDGSGKLRGMGVILSELQVALSGFTTEAQASFIKDVFGVRSIKAIVPVIAEANRNLPKFREEIARANDGLGTMADIYKDLEENFKGASQQAKSSLSSALIQAFRDVEPAFTRLANTAERVFRSEGFKKFVTDLMRGLASLVNFLARHRGELVLLAKAYLAFKVGGVVAGPAVAGFKFITGTMGEAMAAAGGLKIGLRALAGVALRTLIGPVGWITLAAGGIATLLWNLRKVEKIRPENFPIFGADIAKNLAEGVKEAREEVEGLRKQLRQLHNEQDSFEQAGIQSRIDALKVQRDAMNIKVGNELLDQSGVKSAFGGKGGVSFGERSAGATALIAERKVLDDEINLAELSLKELKKLAQQRKDLTDFIDTEQKRQAEIDKNESGTGTRASFDLGALRSAYRERIGIVTSGLTTEKKLLDARRKAGLVESDDFIAKNSALVEEGFKERIGNALAYYDELIQAKKTNLDTDGAIQTAINAQALEIEKIQNKKILDERLALYSELGKANKEFAAQTKKAELKTKGFEARSAKADSTDIFGNVVVSDLKSQRIQSLRDERDEKLRINNRYQAQAGTLLRDAVEFDKKQKEARTAIHEEFEAGKTAITKEENLRRKKDTISNFQALHASTTAMLGTMADYIGDASEKAFRRSKRLRLAQAYMDTAGGAASAFVDTPGPVWVKLAAGIVAAAAGAVRIRQIKAQQYSGQAHDGIANIPQEGTYLLDKNERVVKPTDNKKLERMLDREARAANAGGDGGTLNVTFEIKALDSTGIDQVIVSRRGMIIGMIQQAYTKRGAVGGPLG